MYSIDADSLGGSGYALTLTLRDTPANSADWVALRQRWEDRVRRMEGFVRLHWVIEWQRRGTPHVHAAVYFTEPLWGSGWEIVAQWCAVAQGPYGARPSAQHVAAIAGPLGWLKYLSKHAARGVRHYQRSGKPQGWDTTGRLWGRRGSWPAELPMVADLDMPSYWRYRRLVRSWRIADARASGDARRIAYARRMLACPQPRLSAVRGVSDWLPESVSTAFLVLLAQEGADVAQRP